MYIHSIVGPGDSLPALPAPHRHVTAPPPPVTPQEKEKEKIAKLLAEELEAEAVAVAEDLRILDTRIKNTQDLERSSDRNSEQRSAENAKLLSESSSSAAKAADPFQ